MSYQTVYVHCPQVSQQRKFSTDVLICPTKALLLLKKPYAFSFSCIYELKSNLRHTVFPFHSVIRFDTSYLKYNGIHTTSKPAQQESSSMRSTCLCFKTVFMPCGVPWDLYENMTMMVHFAWVSWTQVWLDWKRCTYCKNHTSEKSMRIDSWAAEYKGIWCRCVWCENYIFC